MGSVISSLPVVGEMSQPAASVPDCEKRGESVYWWGGRWGEAGFKPVLPPPSTTHTPRWAGSWFSGMPRLLSQHWESWLSVLWKMSGLQETKGSHSHHPAGGRGAERAGCRREQGPSVQRAGCERVYAHRGKQLVSKAGGLYGQGRRLGTRIRVFEAQGECAKWRGCM